MQHNVPYELLEAEFRTPCSGRVYDSLPVESRAGRVQLLVPQSKVDACVLHLAATGEWGFERRIRLGTPLLSKVLLDKAAGWTLHLRS